VGGIIVMNKNSGSSNPSSRASIATNHNQPLYPPTMSIHDSHPVSPPPISPTIMVNYRAIRISQITYVFLLGFLTNVNSQRDCLYNLP
jgi:hypothetical protein